MTNKTTKRALLTSVMALFLCFTMLLGTTFAWFTDSVTSSDNIIKSGTLDVTMEWYDGTKAVPDKDSADWIDASTGPIFKSDLWEPGYTEVRHIKIANEGSLALKYQISIAANGEVSELADVIDVYYIDPATQIADRTALVDDNKLGTLTSVLAAISSTASGELKAGENHTVTLALKMRENAGNDYQNKSIGTDFSVILAATQLNSEEDAFGPDYDKGLTPPNKDGDILVEENGIQYYYTADGEYLLYLVTEDYEEDTVVVPEGVTSIGNYAFAHNSNVKEVVLSSTVRSLGRGFDSSTVEKVVLNEGLEQIDSRAFRSTTNLKEVVISSTVKTIEDNAFQKSGIKEIIIPATVETVGETAFGASKIETVTFEGNTSIQGYAFRGCPELRTVTLKGDDVTFIPSTLNGRDSMWFCNGESNNPNTSNITFYVENETVAERVKTAMGAEAGNTPVYIDEEVFVNVKNATEFQSALDNATQDTIINFTADITGNVKVTQKENIEVVINGNDKKFTGVMTVFGNGRKATAALTIQNINFVAENGASSCIVSPDRTVNNAYSYSSNVTVENCTFTDPDGTVNCAAVRHEDGGDSNWKIIGCVVDNTMHSLIQTNNVEIDGLTIQNCKVYSKNGINLNQCTKVSIIDCEIDVKGYAVRYGVDGATVNGTFEIKDSTLKSANDDDDAVIIFRGIMTGSTLTITNTTLLGTPEITGTANVVKN